MQAPAVARTPGATRAGPGEYLFDLAKVNHILGGPDYSTANGACVEGDRMIVGLMRMPAGTGAESALPIWIEIMKAWIGKRTEAPTFEAPGNIVFVSVDRGSGNPAPEGTPGAITESFISGTQPGSGFRQ